MPIDGLFSGIIPVLEQDLAARSKRFDVIVSNIANADTPNYKAFELVLDQQLKEPKPGSAVIELVRTHPAHLSANKTASNGLTLRQAAAPRFSLRGDGNTVDLDNEMTTMAENSIRYKASAQMLRERFKALKLAMTGDK
jgi:flagellar basal-body rod protein FlgB